MTAYDLITVGRANMDLYSRDIGEPFENTTAFDAMVGGSPTNIAIGTARLGLRSIAFTGVGDDRVGAFVIRYLRDENVATDWVSRVKDQPFKDKRVGIVGAAQSPVGTARSQYHLRQNLVGLEALTMNKPELFVSLAQNKFDADGNLTDEPSRKIFGVWLEAFEAWVRRG